MPALGWPVDEGKRRELETAVGFPPPFYRGSTKHLCSLCGLEVWIGPRVAEAVKLGTKPICVFCAVKIDRRLVRVRLVNLGSSDTGYES